MAGTAKKNKSFSVWAKVKVDCLVSIKADSLEDALEQSRKLKHDDFVAILGQCNDINTAVYGVMEEES